LEKVCGHESGSLNFSQILPIFSVSILVLLISVLKPKTQKLQMQMQKLLGESKLALSRQFFVIEIT